VVLVVVGMAERYGSKVTAIPPGDEREVNRDQTSGDIWCSRCPSAPTLASSGVLTSATSPI